MPPFLVVDEDNNITVTVRNNADTPEGPVSINLQYEECGNPPDLAHIDIVRTPPFLPGASFNHTFTWDARRPGTDAADPTATPPALEGNCILVITVLPTARDGVDFRREATFIHHYQPSITVGEILDAKPGETAEQSFRVKNEGNVEDVIRISLDQPEEDPVDNATRPVLGAGGGEWTFLLSEAHIRLQPQQESHILRVYAQVPPDANATDQASATLVAISDGRAESQASAQVGPFEALPLPALSLRVDPTSTSLDPGRLGAARVEITNRGNAADAVDLTVSSASPTIIVSINPSTLDLATGATGAANLTILVDDAALAGPAPVIIRAASHHDSQVTAEAIHTIHVRQRHAVQLERATGTPASSPVVVPPGQETEIVLVVRNAGNGPDNVTLETASLPPGWAARLPQPTFLLAAGASTPASLFLRPKDAQPPTSDLAFNVRATSQGSPIRSVQLTIPLHVPLQRSADLAATDPKIFLPATGPVDATFLVVNNGNVQDTFTLAANFQDVSPAAGWAATVSPASTLLVPGGTATFTVTVQAPAERNVASARLKATLTADDDIEFERTAETLLVGRLPNLEVHAVTATPALPYEGDTLVVQSTIVNTGTQPLTHPFDVRLVVQNDATSATLIDQTHRVNGLGNGPNDAVQLTASAATDGKKGSYTLRVIADSASDAEVVEETKADNEQTLAFEIHDARLLVLAPAAVTLRPSESRLLEGSHTFRVKNDGSYPEPVTITLPDSIAGLTGPSQITLAPGEIRPIPITITMPARPGESTLTVSAGASLAGTNRAPVVNTTSVVVHVTTPPVIASVTADPPVVPIGGTVHFAATINSPVRLREAKLYVTDPSGTLAIHPLQAPDPNESAWTLALVLSQPGAYHYSARATDDSANANRAAPSPERTVSARTNSTPEIRLLSPAEGTPIKDHQTLILHVIDVLPLRRIDAATPGGNQSLLVGNPVRILANMWPEGAALVTVSAENTGGGSTTRSFRFLVDRTPPTIHAPDIQFADDQSSVRLAVRVPSPDVASVTASIRFDALPPITILLTRGSNETFSAETNLSAPPRAVTVTAKDHAGNAAHREFALARPLEASQSAPGVGILLALSAILAIAWRGTHRRPPTHPQRPVHGVLLTILLTSLLLGAAPAANAQSCPIGDPVIIDAGTIITTTYTVQCQRVLLSADLTIARGGRMELGQSFLEIQGARPVTILVQSGGALILHHWTQISTVQTGSADYSLQIARGGVLTAQDATILGAAEFMIQSDAATLRRVTIQPPGPHIGLTVDGATLAATDVDIQGGVVGVVVRGAGQARLESFRVTDQADAGIQLLEATRLTLVDAQVTGAPNAIIAIGNTHATIRNTTLQGSHKTLVTLDSSGQSPLIQLEGVAAPNDEFQLTPNTRVERSWFVATLTHWVQSAPPGATAGSPAADAVVEIRNATGATLITLRADHEGRTGAVLVKTSSLLGTTATEHGPFRFLLRHHHSATSTTVPVTSDHVAEDTLALALTYDEDTQPPTWDGDEPVLNLPPISRDTVTLTWRPATDHASPEHPNRDVAGYKVLRIRQTEAAQEAGFAPTATFTDKQVQDGLYYYRVRPVDLAGNVGAESEFAETLVDKTAPSLVVQHNRTPPLRPGNFSQPVRIEATATDAGTGVKTIRYLVGSAASSEPVEITQPGFYVVRVEAEDHAGNVATAYANTTLSLTPPNLRLRLLPNQPDGADGWYRTLPLLNLTATTDGPAPLADLRYRWGQDAWTPFTTDVRLEGSGNRDLHVSARDAAGNEALLSRLVKIDRDAPLVQVDLPAPDGNNGWYRTAPNATCTSSDADSGVQRRQLRTAQTDWRDIQSSAKIQHEGTTLITCRATDAAGNTGESAPSSVRIDTQPPLAAVVVIVTDPSRPDRLVADWTQNPPLDVTSGIVKVRLLRAIDNAPFETVAELAPEASSIPITSPATGNATYALEAVDAAGHAARSTFATATDRGIRLLGTSEPVSPRRVAGPTVLRAEPPVGFEVAQAEFYLDGVLIGATAAPPFEHALDSRSLEDGVYDASIVLVSTSGVLYEQPVSLEIRNSYGALLQDQGWLLPATATTLLLNVVVGLVGVRRWVMRT